MIILALIFGLLVMAGLLTWLAAAGFMLGVGVLLGLLLVVSGLAWKTRVSPRLVTIAGLSVITVAFLGDIVKDAISFGVEWARRDIIPGLILLGVLALLMRTVWKSDKKWVSLLTTFIGYLLLFPSTFLLGWFLDAWRWGSPDVDNLLLSLLFAVGVVLVLVGGAGALFRRLKTRAP